MNVNRKLKTVIPKGKCTRYIGTPKNQTVLSDSFAHSPVSGNHSKTLALVEGDFIAYKIENSFTLHGGTTRELINFQVISSAQKALVVTIVLKGQIDFSYDELSFSLNADRQKSALVVNLAKPVSFRRKLYKNNHVSKLTVAVPIPWIKNRSKNNEHITTFINQHLANFQLNLTPSLLALAEKIIQLGTPVSFIENIQTESLTQSLMLEVFKQLEEGKFSFPLKEKCEEANLAHQQTDSFTHTLDILLAHIEANLDHQLSNEYLASFAKMSLSNLQRKFKNELGASPKSYIRRRRLEIARQQLKNGLVSITEAAYNSGYRHPSNFTIAFKKAFGCSPQNAIKK